MEIKTENSKRRVEILKWTLLKLIDEARKEGIEKYKEKIWQTYKEIVEMKHKPLTDYIEDLISDLTVFQKEAEARKDYSSALTFRMTRVICRFLRWLIAEIINDKTECFLADIVGFLRVGREFDEIYETMGVLTMATVKQIEPSKEIKQKLEELSKEIEALKRRKIEVYIRTSENIERELKEWLEERERMKKAMKQYIG